MSQIYSDAAGNKYLGDCRWGNHDINYPTTDFLQGVGLSSHLSFYSDGASLLTSQGYTSVSSYAFDLPGTSIPVNTILFQGISSGRTQTFAYKNGGYYGAASYGTIGVITGNVDVMTATTFLHAAAQFDYAMASSSDSLAIVGWRPGSNLINFNALPSFSYMGFLQDVNTNFSYYSASDLNKAVVMHFVPNSQGNPALTGYWTSPIPEYSSSTTVFDHYIAFAQKSLLQSGRAAYTISCSDGQTPGAQWATDMWVYDNNATLGHPVIGRVPNMLLGIGTYTYLKPVKILGSVFPDNGSPWYLPVGTFAGKTLLMRCYSSMG